MHETRPSLILRVRDPSNLESWQEFVELYQPMLVRFACRQGLSEPDAQDIAQDILIKLLRLMPTFELDAQLRFRGWLSRMVYNAVITWHRARQRQNRLQDAIREDEMKRQLLDPEEPPAEWSNEHRKRVLAYATKRVRERTKPIMKWKCFEQHLLRNRPAAEVGRELGISTNYVYVNASRILKEVRDQCAEYEEDLIDAL